MGFETFDEVSHCLQNLEVIFLTLCGLSLINNTDCTVLVRFGIWKLFLDEQMFKCCRVQTGRVSFGVMKKHKRWNISIKFNTKELNSVMFNVDWFCLKEQLKHTQINSEKIRVPNGKTNPHTATAAILEFRTLDLM